MLLGGLAAPLLPLLAYFLREHLLGTMWWTYITYPPKIVRSIDPPPFSRLREGVWFFVRNFAWLGVLATAAFTPLRRRRDPLIVGLVIWFVVGWATVVIQNQWGYQFMLPLVPLGLLAGFGVDRLCAPCGCARASGARYRSRSWSSPHCFALYPAKQAAHTVKALVRDDFTRTASGRHRFEAEFEPYYPQARRPPRSCANRGAHPARSTSRAIR